jgi:asparagine synthase (glutamine-hydrolysing)
MCGIAGVVGPGGRDELEGLLRRLHHRGPDGDGVYEDREQRVGLVNTRLAILDIEGGEQPMASDDGLVTLVFNGEIFNAPELRRTLEQAGVCFRSDHSDTEVVLRLYEQRGEAMLGELNGMFALAIHDRRRRVVIVARDRFGIKPLYYAERGNGLAFASELRALLPLDGVSRELDPTSLFHFVSLRFVPGERSIFRGTKRLPAGHLLRADLDSHRIDVERWYRLEFEPDHSRSRDEWVELLRERLDAAVRRWALSDVPVACSLSGGIDSSAVLALLASAGGKDIRSYTLGFATRDAHSLDELPLARAQAERWGSEHHELIVDSSELINDLPNMVVALDEPYGGGLPSWYVFEFMSRDVKVALTGTGGDELFGNYRRFEPFEGRLARLARRAGPLAALAGEASRLPLGARGQAGLSRLGALHADSFAANYFDLAYYFTDEVKRELLAVAPDEETAPYLASIFAESGSRSHRDSVLYLDVSTQLVDEFLLMTDRFSMAHSLEARVPFLDNELVDLVAAMPPEIRTSRDAPKGLLRDAVADLLTPGHLTAPKQGFVFPLGAWLRGELRPLAERLLSDERLQRQGLFRPGLAARFLEPHLAGSADETERLWPLLMFQLWHLLVVEGGATDAGSIDLRELAGAA